MAKIPPKQKVPQTIQDAVPKTANTLFKEKSWYEFDSKQKEIHKQFYVPLSNGEPSLQKPIIPNNPAEAFDIFKKCFAAVQFYLQIHFFNEKYFVWNSASISAEIAEIEMFIAQAKKINYAEACATPLDDNALHEYLRLKNGFYEGYLMNNYTHWDDNSLSATVYGRYEQFYHHLQERLPKPKRTGYSPSGNTGSLKLEGTVDKSHRQGDIEIYNDSMHLTGTVTKKRQNKGKEIPMTLEQVWNKEEGYTGSYQRVIDFLKKEEIITKNLEWPDNNPNGRKISKFVSLCYKHGFIKKQYSAPELKQIINNTFSCNFHTNCFKQQRLNFPGIKDLELFKSFPQSTFYK